MVQLLFLNAINDLDQETQENHSASYSTMSIQLMTTLGHSKTTHQSVKSDFAYKFELSTTNSRFNVDCEV